MPASEPSQTSSPVWLCTGLQHLLERTLAGLLRLGKRVPGTHYLVHDLLQRALDLVRGEVLDGRVPHRRGEIELAPEEGHNISGERLTLPLYQGCGEYLRRHLSVGGQVGEMADPGLDAHAAQVVQPGEGLRHLAGTFGDHQPVRPIARDRLA